MIYSPDMNVQDGAISSQMFLFLLKWNWFRFWHRSKPFMNTSFFWTSILWSIDIIIAILIVNYIDKVRKSELFRSWHSSIQGHSSARGGAILQRGEITKVLASKQKFKSSGSENAQFSLFFKFKQLKLPLQEKDIHIIYWNTWRNVIFIFVLMHSAVQS